MMGSTMLSVVLCVLIITTTTISCEHLVDIASPLPGGYCRSGFTEYREGGVCLKIRGSFTRLQEALGTCRVHGLVNITNKHMLDFVQRTYRGYLRLWIGDVYDEAPVPKEPKWTPVDSVIGCDSKHKYFTLEHGAEGYLKRTPNYALRGFVCEIVKNVRAHNICPPGWIHAYYDMRCFKKFDEPTKYIDSHRICRKHKGKIASIWDEDEYKYLKENVRDPKLSYWVGLKITNGYWTNDGPSNENWYFTSNRLLQKGKLTVYAKYHTEAQALCQEPLSSGCQLGDVEYYPLRLCVVYIAKKDYGYRKNYGCDPHRNNRKYIPIMTKELQEFVFRNAPDKCRDYWIGSIGSVVRKKKEAWNPLPLFTGSKVLPCVKMTEYQRLLTWEYCDVKNQFICEKIIEKGTSESGCESGWDHYEVKKWNGDEKVDYCLQLFKIQYSFVNAKAYCEMIGGHLAMPKTEERLSAIKDTGKGSIFNDFWVGMEYKKIPESPDEEVYIYADGTDMGNCQSINSATGEITTSQNCFVKRQRICTYAAETK